MGRNITWQNQGGSLVVPENHIVCGADFDTDEPYIVVCPENGTAIEDVKIPVPKAMAYYLSTHFCGSDHMRDLIRDHARSDIAKTIKGALGL